MFHSLVSKSLSSSFNLTFKKRLNNFYFIYWFIIQHGAVSDHLLPMSGAASFVYFLCHSLGIFYLYSGTYYFLSSGSTTVSENSKQQPWTEDEGLGGPVRMGIALKENKVVFLTALLVFEIRSQVTQAGLYTVYPRIHELLVPTLRVLELRAWSWSSCPAWYVLGNRPQGSVHMGDDVMERAHSEHLWILVSWRLY